MEMENQIEREIDATGNLENTLAFTDAPDVLARAVALSDEPVAHTDSGVDVVVVVDIDIDIDVDAIAVVDVDIDIDVDVNVDTHTDS